MQNHLSGSVVAKIGTNSSPNSDSRQQSFDAASASALTGPGTSRQLPISRQPPLIAGYERAERARTSHACEPCRERKTKCDGERPSCRRCLHNGTPCHYGYGKGWKKRKTAEDLTATSRKLDRYEELLQEIYPLVTEEIREKIQIARQQAHFLGNGNDSPDTNMSGAVGHLDGEQRTTSLPMSKLPLPVIGPGPTNSIPAFLTPHNSAPPLLGGDATFHASQLKPHGLPARSASADEPQQSPTSAVRLPSITPQGFLLESSAALLRPASFKPPVSDNLMPKEDLSLAAANKEGLPDITP